MSVEREEVVLRIRNILSEFITQKMSLHFNSELWSASMMSKPSLDENDSAENFSDFKFLGPHVIVDHIDPYLVNQGVDCWVAKIVLVASVDAEEHIIPIRFGFCGKSFEFLEFQEEDDSLNNFSDNEIELIRKRLGARLGRFQDLYK